MKAKYSAFAELLHSLAHGSYSCPVFANRRAGKTALVMRLLEHIHAINPKRPIVLYNFPFRVRRYLPRWIIYVDSLDQVPVGAVLFRDDTVLSDDTHAKRSMSKEAVEYSRFLALMGQKKILSFFTVQTTALFNKDAFRFGQNILFFKYYDELSRIFEREELGVYIDSIMEIFHRYIRKGYNPRQLTYVVSPFYSGLFLNTLPSFWSEVLSEAFKYVEVGV